MPANRKLGKTTDQRMAMLRQQVTDFLDKGRMETTVTRAKEIAPVKQEALLALTGYVRGGCSPLGMKKQFKTFIDQSALAFDKIHVSAGVRGTQLALSPQDLAKACAGEFVDLELEG